MKVLYFIDCFEAGGAARLISSICNGLVERNHEIYIASNYNRPVNYPLNDGIKRIEWYDKDYYNKNTLIRLFDVTKKARRIIKEVKPDIIVSTIPHIIFLTRIAGVGMKIPFIFADETSFARKESFFIHFIRFHFYNLADRITILTQNDYDLLGKRLPRKVVINNPLSFPIYEGNSPRERVVLAIGHTDRWQIKGLDLLLKAWGIVFSNHPDWRLDIMGGESPKTRTYLDQIIKENHTEQSVNFLGFRMDSDDLMQKASIFALSSRIEGFSLALTEALSQGLPCVSFKIKGVINDVSGGGHGTILVNDGDILGFAKSINSLIDDEDKRLSLAKDGKVYVSRYALGPVVDKWEYLFKEILNL